MVIKVATYTLEPLHLRCSATKTKPSVWGITITEPNSNGLPSLPSKKEKKRSTTTQKKNKPVVSCFGPRFATVRPRISPGNYNNDFQTLAPDHLVNRPNQPLPSAIYPVTNEPSSDPPLTSKYRVPVESHQPSQATHTRVSLQRLSIVHPSHVV